MFAEKRTLTQGEISEIMRKSELIGANFIRTAMSDRLKFMAKSHVDRLFDGDLDAIEQKDALKDIQNLVDIDGAIINAILLLQMGKPE